MKYRLGVTLERPGGGWVKIDVELEQDDLEAAAAEAGVSLEGFSVAQRHALAQAAANEVLIRDLFAQGITDPARLKPLIDARAAAKKALT